MVEAETQRSRTPVLTLRTPNALRYHQRYPGRDIYRIIASGPELNRQRLDIYSTGAHRLAWRDPVLY